MDLRVSLRTHTHGKICKTLPVLQDQSHVVAAAVVELLGVDEHAVGPLGPELDLQAELVLGLGERPQLHEGRRRPSEAVEGRDLDVVLGDGLQGGNSIGSEKGPKNHTKMPLKDS